MSLHDHLMTWPLVRLVKELQHQARENAHLREQVVRLECELFWLKAPKPDPTAELMPGMLATAQQALARIEAYQQRQAERELSASTFRRRADDKTQ